MKVYSIHNIDDDGDDDDDDDDDDDANDKQSSPNFTRTFPNIL